MLRPAAKHAHSVLLAAFLAFVAPASFAQSKAAPNGDCGEVVTVPAHGGSSTRYALASAPGSRIALVLLVGGEGHVDLDDKGCARALKGNSLVRALPLFHDAGFVTALVDAPSDHAGPDGLAGYRTDPQHAQDLGTVIADLRARTGGVVWLVGTSRGTISAVNAASRLAGPASPDGLVLTSALTSGASSRRKPWVTQTVFDLPLEAIRIPLLVVGHAGDSCVRSPPAMMNAVTARTHSSRQQVVTVSGGPGGPRAPGVDACEGRSPHGFIEQEAELAAGIARFIQGGTY